MEEYGCRKHNGGELRRGIAYQHYRIMRWSDDRAPSCGAISTQSKRRERTHLGSGPIRMGSPHQNQPS
ncbi:hypothetical protein ABIB73_005627 [Bradyrhizobium sp. F1.4.3]